MCLGLATGYINKDDNNSLLKPYTNFDNLKDMNIDEMAEFLCRYAYITIYKFCDKCNIEINKETCEEEYSNVLQEYKDFLNKKVEDCSL